MDPVVKKVMLVGAAGMALCGVLGVGYRARFGIQVLYIENASSEDVAIEAVSLKCDRLVLGTLRPGETRGRLFVRSCGGDAGYALEVRQGGGSVHHAEACYVGKLPTVNTIRITDGPKVECRNPGVFTALLDKWRG